MVLVVVVADRLVVVAVRLVVVVVPVAPLR
jgi:hypothetical protein